MGNINGISPHQMKCLLWLRENPQRSPAEYANWICPSCAQVRVISEMFSRMIDSGLITEQHVLTRDGLDTARDYSFRQPRHVPVPGFDGYFATRSGEVWSNRLPAKRRRDILRRLKGRPLNSYLKIQLYTNSGVVTTTIHSVIARTFHGDPEEGMQCRHLDGNPNNNHADNLQWGTAKQNSEDRDRHGRTPVGERHHATSITKEDAILIRQLASEGMSYSAIGYQMNLKRTTVGAIARKQNWGHV